MSIDEYIYAKVHSYYWQEDLNCATTMLKILSEIFNLNLQEQVVQAAIGMHGAGGYRAQCGLVEGGLMFIGVAGLAYVWPTERTVVLCKNYAKQFDERFGSLLCRDLRPAGFSLDNPPHLCERLTVEAVMFAAEYMRLVMSND